MFSGATPPMIERTSLRADYSGLPMTIEGLIFPAEMPPMPAFPAVDKEWASETEFGTTGPTVFGLRDPTFAAVTPTSHRRTHLGAAQRSALVAAGGGPEWRLTRGRPGAASRWDRPGLVQR